MSIATDKLALAIYERRHGKILVRGPDFNPWVTVQEVASVVIDAVLSGRYHLHRKEDQDLRRMMAELMRLAHRVYAEQHPRSKLRWGAWARHGIRWIYPGGGGEHHAYCIFCRANLATVGRGSHSFTRAMTDSWEAHTFVCALQLLGPESLSTNKETT